MHEYEPTSFTDVPTDAWKAGLWSNRISRDYSSYVPNFSHAPQERYRAKLALAKSLYRRGWERGDILERFRFIDQMRRLPEALEEQLRSEIQTFETVEQMPYVTSIERIGIRKGIQQDIEQATREGLQRQRHTLPRLVQVRFGADVAQASGPLIARIVDPQRLDGLAEVGCNSPDAEAWLAALRPAAE